MLFLMKPSPLSSKPALEKGWDLTITNCSNHCTTFPARVTQVTQLLESAVQILCLKPLFNTHIYIQSTIFHMDDCYSCTAHYTMMWTAKWRNKHKMTRAGQNRKETYKNCPKSGITSSKKNKNSVTTNQPNTIVQHLSFSISAEMVHITR